MASSRVGGGACSFLVPKIRFIRYVELYLPKADFHSLPGSATKHLLDEGLAVGAAPTLGKARHGQQPWQAT